MTNKEAIELLNRIAPVPTRGGGKSTTHLLVMEAIIMAIKALEQQPCEDCISREELINELKLGYFNKDLQEAKNDPCVIDAMIDWAIRTAKRLPSVTPSRPKGKWIHWTDDYKDYVTCSCCEYGEEGEVLLSDKTPFCPICGADMRESEVHADEDSN